MKQIILPKLGIKVWLKDRHEMRKGHPTARYEMSRSPRMPSVKLPIDWTKGDKLSFPILGNDQVGDCMYAAALHADQTWTGNVGTQSTWDTATTIKYYEALSGGDNGLDEGDLVGEWKKGLDGNKSASILDALDIDPNNAPMMQESIGLFGGVIFMLAIPDAWYDNFDTNYVWDAPAQADEMNGHGVWFNGVDTAGKYKMQTWGTHGWVTPKGVADCDPSAFTVFSLRWFNAQGVAPNGMTYDQLATIWQQAGGKKLPPSPFGPSPVPVPVPVPTGKLFSVTVSSPIPVGGRVDFQTKIAIPAGHYDWVPSV